MSEQQRESLIAEFKGLNLNKFIQEAVTSLVEGKIKVIVHFQFSLCLLYMSYNLSLHFIP